MGIKIGLTAQIRLELLLFIVPSGCCQFHLQGMFALGILAIGQHICCRGQSL